MLGGKGTGTDGRKSDTGTDEMGPHLHNPKGRLAGTQA